MSVRVRFAPSPTGQVHIGNIRVAIFNWLFARHEGGQFLIRIEDTDRERSTPDAVQAVFDALEWLGLNADEEPTYQSKRREAHLEAAEQLQGQGDTYLEDKGDTGRGDCVVFKMPETEMSFDDEVKGRLAKQPEDLKDFVIIRSDGSPVFHLGNVVDDIEMGITHVIRGDDHIENTYRHVALYRALGAEIPKFVHLPMIVNERGKPYSKRDGAAFVGQFRERGFLADALFNYLALLGWSPGDDREVMMRDEMINAFSLSGINSAAGRMDMTKLEWMNGEYIRQMPGDDFKAEFQRALTVAGLPAEENGGADLGRVVGMMQERTRIFSDIPADAGFFFTDEFTYDDKAVRKHLTKPDVDTLLAEVRAPLSDLEDFSEEAIEAAVRECADAHEMKASKLVHPLRVATSGISKGPGLFEMMAALGRQRVLDRIDKAITIIEKAGE
jgi:glutamyl-tRNA synthetase